MDNTTSVMTNYFSKEDINFIKRLGIRIPKKTIFMSQEKYDMKINIFSSKIAKLKENYGIYIPMVERIYSEWNEYLSYMFFLEEKPEKLDLPQKELNSSKLNLDRLLDNLIKENARISVLCSRIDEMKSSAKFEVMKKILEDAIANSPSTLDVVVLRSDYSIQYEENRKGFIEIVNNMAEGSYKGIIAIVGIFGCEHIAFIPEYTSAERILKIWRPTVPFSVKCTYIYHKY